MRVESDYLAREARARSAIDKQLAGAGWRVQPYRSVNLAARRGVAVREFVLEKGHGRADYLLFLDGRPTGAETHFTNLYDPDARSRRVFSFPRPETLAEWARQIAADPDAPTFRARLRNMPELDPAGPWDVQAEAIRNTEEPLRQDRPRALIQMATGAGKTFTAANLFYRLIKHAEAGRVLFLVERANLDKQARQEFDRFVIPETQRKFPADEPASVLLEQIAAEREASNGHKPSGKPRQAPPQGPGDVQYVRVMYGGSVWPCTGHRFTSSPSWLTPWTGLRGGAGCPARR